MYYTNIQISGTCTIENAPGYHEPSFKQKLLSDQYTFDTILQERSLETH